MATTAPLTENSRQGFEVQKPPCIGFEANLSRNPRRGCGHAYDETASDLAVYVRNDPINLVDGNGKWWECDEYSEGECVSGFFDPNPHMIPWSTSNDTSTGSLDNDDWTSDCDAEVDWEVGAFTKEGSQANAVYNITGALTQVLALDSSCYKALGEDKAIDTLNQLISGKAMGVGTLTASVTQDGKKKPCKNRRAAAITGVAVPSDYAAIVVDSQGAFFTNGPSAGVSWSSINGIAPNTNAYRALVILHELAHILNRMPSDGADPQQSYTNNVAIATACQKALSYFKD